MFLKSTFITRLSTPKVTRRETQASKQPHNMQPIDLLTSLPASLACVVFKDWLTLKSVVALDYAYCANAHRERFLNLLRSNEYCISQQLPHSIIRSIDLTKYGNSVRSVYFADDVPQARAEALLQHCHHLTHVHFDRIEYIQPELWTLLTLNPHMECFKITSNIGRTMNLDGPQFRLIKLPKLRELSLRNVMFTGSEHWLDAFQMSSNIVRLDLFGSSISQPILLQIPKFCLRLTHLGLSRTRLSDEVLTTIAASCQHIVHLDISNNYMLTDESIGNTVQMLKRLQSLCIKQVAGLTDVSLQHIVTHCANTLHTLHFDNSEQEGEGPYFTREAINLLLERCLKLRTVHFGTVPIEYSSNFAFTPAAISNVTTLVLSGGIICNENLTYLAKYAVNLRILSIYENEGDNYVFVQEGLKSLCFGCPQLRELYLFIEHTMPYMQLFFDLWTALKPQLSIRMYPPHHLAYNVLNIVTV